MRLTEEQRKAIFEASNKSLSISDIAKEVELDYRTIRSALKSKWFATMEIEQAEQIIEPQIDKGSDNKEPVNLVEPTEKASIIEPQNDKISDNSDPKNLVESKEELPPELITKDRVFQVLNKVEIGKFVPKAINDFLTGLLEYHPREDKLKDALRHPDGNLITAIKPHCPNKPKTSLNNRCVYFKKKNGEWEDISVIKCINHVNAKQRRI